MILYRKFFGNYVIYTKNANSLNATLTKIKNSPNWNEMESPKYKFLIVPKEEHSLRDLFLILFDYDIITGIVVTSTKKGARVHISEPFAPGSACGRFPKIYTYENCDNTISGLANIDRSIVKLNGCVIKFGFIIPRDKSMPIFVIFWSIMDLLGEVLNTTVINVTNVEINWIARMYNRSENISLGMHIAKTFDTLEFAEVTESGHHNKLVWIVPAPSKISDVKIIASVFDGTLWLSVFMALLLEIFLWWLIVRATNESTAHKNFTTTAFTVYAISIGGSTTFSPRTSKFSKCSYTASTRTWNKNH